MSDDLYWRDAHDLAGAIRRRQLSSVDLIRSFLGRIEELDGVLNAFLFVIAETEAVQAAQAADRAVAQGARLGPLHGLPIALKDLMDVKGMRTSSGTSIRQHHIAAHDSVLAEKLRAAGAIIIGKTNTPEFGLGTVTFNDLGGPTRNPWDRSRHAGGSSGGAAAAVAAAMLPFADGSDSGGSIRYPASFCNIVGLRPSPGRVPTGRLADGWNPHGVLGPMARNPRDAGLLLAGMAGEDWRSPMFLREDPMIFANIEAAALGGLRVAWSRSIGGLPIEAEITAVLEQARDRLVALGCVVEDVEPCMDDADQCWEIIEMHGFLASCAADVAAFGDRLRPDVVENVRLGAALSAEQIAWALTARTEIYRRTASLLQRYDVLALPAAPVAAPPADWEWVHEIAGVRMERYFGWQRCASRITVTAHPALSMPAGFTAAGLPVGLQLVGRMRDDYSLLRVAAAFDDATGYSRLQPADIGAARFSSAAG